MLNYLYIDPGTGSMLFTVLLGVFGAGIYAVRALWMKLRFRASGGKAKGEQTAPLTIFSDDKRYWTTFRPLCDLFEKRMIPLVYWTCSPDDPALKAEYEYVKAECIGEINRAVTRLNVMKADICIATTPGLDVYQWKRSKDCSYYIHLLHAVGDPALYRMFGLDYYDAVLLTGPFQEGQQRRLEEVRGIPAKDLEITGLIYMDELLERRKKIPSSPKDRITVLLAPSWGESCIFRRYGARIIESLRDTGYRIIIRPHPQSLISDKEALEPLQEKYPNSEDISWNYDADNFDVLNEADIMISDYSGVIFDYALVFDRPVIYADTSFDKSPYDAAWLEEEPWVFQILPEIGVPLTEDDLPRMKDVIDEALASKTLDAGRERARHDSWAFIGESAERTMQYLLNKKEELAHAV